MSFYAQIFVSFFVFSSFQPTHTARSTIKVSNAARLWIRVHVVQVLTFCWVAHDRLSVFIQKHILFRVNSAKKYPPKIVYFQQWIIFHTELFDRRKCLLHRRMIRMKNAFNQRKKPKLLQLWYVFVQVLLETSHFRHLLLSFPQLSPSRLEN